MTGISGNLYWYSFIILFILFPPYLKGQFTYDLNKDVEGAYEDVLKLRLGDAGRHVEAINESNLFRVLLTDYVAFARLMVNGSEQDLAIYHKQAENRYKNLKRLDVNSPFHLYAMAEIKLHISVAEARYGKMWRSGRSAMSANRALEKNLEIYPEFDLNLKTLGLLHIAMGSMPLDKELKWLISMLSRIEGNVEKGAEELERAMQFAEKHYSIFADEIRFEQLFFQMQITGDHEQAGKLAEDLRIGPDESPLVGYILAYLNLKLNNNQEAMLALSAVPQGGAYERLPILDYMEGKARMQLLDLTAAAYFEHFLANHTGFNFVKDAWWQLAKCASLAGDRQKFAQLKLNTLKEGRIKSDIDLLAHFEASLPDSLNIQITKSRLLCDGGYYSAALYELEQINSPANLSERQKQAYYYRKARIEQARNFLNVIHRPVYGSTQIGSFGRVLCL